MYLNSENRSFRFLAAFILATVPFESHVFKDFDPFCCEAEPGLGSTFFLVFVMISHSDGVAPCSKSGRVSWDITVTMNFFKFCQILQSFFERLSCVPLETQFIQYIDLSQGNGSFSTIFHRFTTFPHVVTP